MSESGQKSDKELFERMVDTVLAYRPKKRPKKKRKIKANKKKPLL
jgi:hypothetical protein